MVHCNMVNNVAHVLEVLAAMMTVRHNPFAVNINLNIVLAFCKMSDTNKKTTVFMLLTFCDEPLEYGGKRVLIAVLTGAI